MRESQSRLIFSIKKEATGDGDMLITTFSDLSLNTYLAVLIRYPIEFSGGDIKNVADDAFTAQLYNHISLHSYPVLTQNSHPCYDRPKVNRLTSGTADK
jgi:hypothetical protein